jgi:hypothetical protein
LGIRRRRTCSLCGASPESSRTETAPVGCRKSDDAEDEHVILTVRRADAKT